jgi:hypothetical protein
LTTVLLLAAVLSPTLQESWHIPRKPSAFDPTDIPVDGKLVLKLCQGMGNIRYKGGFELPASMYFTRQLPGWCAGAHVSMKQHAVALAEEQVNTTAALNGIWAGMHRATGFRARAAAAQQDTLELAHGTETIGPFTGRLRYKPKGHSSLCVFSDTQGQWNLPEWCSSMFMHLVHEVRHEVVYVAAAEGNNCDAQS